VPESSLIAGRFGRMFRNLPSYEPSNTTMNRCVRQLVEASGETSDNPRIPAGFTYLGQFLDHDLTFDPVSSLERQNDPDGLRNFRTPRLDLDCVYGLGRADQPYLFSAEDPAKLLVGAGESPAEEDLPRNAEDVALIGDPRNDENIIVSQVQLAFIKLHNQIVTDLRSGRFGEHLWATGDLEDGNFVFREAQRLARWHYQWIIAKEFLPLICGDDLVGSLLEETPVDEAGDALQDGIPAEDAAAVRRRVRGLEYYRPQQIPFIPIEWSVAAYRYGHSQIRPDYVLNEHLADLRRKNGQKPGIDIFIEDPGDSRNRNNLKRLQHLAGGRKLPPIWTLDWRLFFKQNATGTPPDARVEPQKSRLIDSRLAGGLKFLPGVDDAARILADLNLRRGRAMGLPSGQAVARRMSVRPLDDRALGLDGEAPLWFYVLKEAEERADSGQHLGPVGGRIVAEVILGMLREDPFSFLRTDPTWEPVLPANISSDPKKWGMADLLAYAFPNDGRIFPAGGPGGQ
jgi:hypothetical protein